MVVNSVVSCILMIVVFVFCIMITRCVFGWGVLGALAFCLVLVCGCGCLLWCVCVVFGFVLGWLWILWALVVVVYCLVWLSLGFALPCWIFTLVCLLVGGFACLCY